MEKRQPPLKYEKIPSSNLMGGVKVNKMYDLVQSFITGGASDLSPKS